MAQATPILHPPAPTVTVRDAPGCTAILAKHYAKKAVLPDYKAAGVRLQWLSRAEIDRKAMAYLEEHRDEMIAKAIDTIRHSPQLQKLCEQERRRRQLREKGSSNRTTQSAHSMRLSERRR